MTLMRAGKKLAEMTGVQCVGRKTPLPFPVLAFCREYAGDAHLFEYRVNRPYATIQLWALAQYVLDLLGIGDHDDRFSAQLEGEERAELVAPSFEHAMELLQVQLQEVAEERQTSWPG